MKYLLILSFLLVFVGCNKDATPNCDIVVNLHGPSFVKVSNNYPETILVDLHDFNLPFRSHMKTNECNIFGLPVDIENIIISTNNGSKKRDVKVDTKEGETITIIVGKDFF